MTTTMMTTLVSLFEYYQMTLQCQDFATPWWKINTRVLKKAAVISVSRRRRNTHISHICFQQKSTTLAYVLEVTVIHCLYVQINYVNPFLSLDAYFVFFDYQQCFLLLYLLYYSTITFAFVICSNKESSIPLVQWNVDVSICVLWFIREQWNKTIILVISPLKNRRTRRRQSIISRSTYQRIQRCSNIQLTGVQQLHANQKLIKDDLPPVCCIAVALCSNYKIDHSAFKI